MPEANPKALRNSGTRIHKMIDSDLAKKLKRRAKLEGISLTAFLVGLAQEELAGAKAPEAARRSPRLPHVA